jgi:hypothetical protein
MTKYKTNAQKLKFFNDAKASRKARMFKAQPGIIIPPDYTEKPIPKPTTTEGELQWTDNGPRSAWDRLDPITGNIRPQSFPKQPFSSIRPKDPTKKYKEVTPKDIDFMLDPPTPKNPMDYMKKGGSTKRKKRK